MRLRDEILYMSFDAGLVVLGMVLNSLVSGNADAQVSLKNATFRYITCEKLFIKDGYRTRETFGLSWGIPIIAPILILPQDQHLTQQRN